MHHQTRREIIETGSVTSFNSFEGSQYPSEAFRNHGNLNRPKVRLSKTLSKISTVAASLEWLITERSLRDSKGTDLLEMLRPTAASASDEIRETAADSNLSTNSRTADQEKEMHVGVVAINNTSPRPSNSELLGAESMNTPSGIGHTGMEEEPQSSNNVFGHRDSQAQDRMKPAERDPDFASESREQRKREKNKRRRAYRKQRKRDEQSAVIALRTTPIANPSTAQHTSLPTLEGRFTVPDGVSQQWR